MKRFLFYFLLTVFVLSILNGQTANVQSAAPFDTDFVTWHQPNGVTFIAWFWGDEFISWFETQDGYRIYRAANGWITTPSLIQLVNIQEVHSVLEYK